jgi:hypothetical protein
MRRWGWTLAMVACVSGCYIPGSGWTLRSGIDLRTHRKPAVFAEMVDSRWDEWNRVAQMNAMGGGCPVPGGGGLVVESSVYAASAPASTGVASAASSGAAPGRMDAPGGSPASSGAIFNEPVQAPPVAPVFPAVPGVEQLPAPPATIPNPAVGAPPPAPSPANDPVAQVAGQMNPRGPALPESFATPSAAQPSAQLGPGRLGGASGPSPSREILFDTPLDPERNRVQPADGIAEPAARPGDGVGRSTTRRDPRVELQSLVSDEPPEAPPGRGDRRESFDLRDSTVNNPTAKPVQRNAGPAATSAPVQPTRRWWSRMNPFAP